MKDMRDYLAQEVMGYHKGFCKKYDDIDCYLFDDDTKVEVWYDSDGNPVMEVKVWNPLENAYQARNVLRKLVEKGMIKCS